MRTKSRLTINVLQNQTILFSFLFFIQFTQFVTCNTAFSLKPFFHTPRQPAQPKLVLISGCTGTGKSTFGMSLALGQGILRCLSTDSVRQVMRTYDKTPALHRSSYVGNGNPVENWLECSDVLQESINSLVDDAIGRGISLVMEGVHIIPNNDILNRWTDRGGRALGILLTIKDEDAHRGLIYNRGEITTKGAEQQIKAFSRIREIQRGMIDMASKNNWLIIEQRIEPDPIDIVTDILDQGITNPIRTSV